MSIKPRIEDADVCAALARIPQTPDGPNWEEAEPADISPAQKLIGYYWRFALNCASQELKRLNCADSVPRSARNRIDEYAEEYCDDGATDPDERGLPDAVPDGVGMYLGEFRYIKNDGCAARDLPCEQRPQSRAA